MVAHPGPPRAIIDNEAPDESLALHCRVRLGTASLNMIDSI